MDYNVEGKKGNKINKTRDKLPDTQIDKQTHDNG